MNGNPSDSADAEGYAAWVEATLRGDHLPDQAERLRAALRSDPSALDDYLNQLRAHALLEWRSGTVLAHGADAPGVVSAEERVPPPPVAVWQRTVWRPKVWGAAAAVLLTAALTFIVIRRPGSSGPPPQMAVAEAVADVAEVRDVVWAGGQPLLSVGSALGPGDLAITAGTIRLNTRRDAAVTVVGPARVHLVSAGRLQAITGRITARVGPAGKGFTVEAPGVDVVDLGTEFGVQVGPGGETAVVVFEGEVDLTRKPAPGAAPSTAPAATGSQGATRLAKGQAVRISPAGTVDRIVAVERAADGGDWAVGPAAAPDAVIADIRDNIRDVGRARFYQIVRRGMTEDAHAYVDRPHEWNGVDANGIPPELLGADLLMTFNDDKRAYGLELSVTLSRPAAVYVLFKPHGPVVPAWLRRDFVDTGLKIGMDEGPPDLPNSTLGKGAGASIERVFHVWRRDVMSAGTIVLGPNVPDNNSMYGVAAVALP